MFDWVMNTCLRLLNQIHWSRLKFRSIFFDFWGWIKSFEYKYLRTTEPKMVLQTIKIMKKD